MTPTVFRAFRDIAYQQAGITLRDGKETLVSARLSKRVRTLGLASMEAYLEHLRGDTTGAEMVTFLDAISTNFTSFFRERDHFDVLTAEARAHKDRGGSRFRVWCAAASTGEEPYSIALTLVEAFAGSSVDHKILATDISTRVLSHARKGLYGAAQVEPVPRELRARYFTRVADPTTGDPFFQVAAELTRHLTFARLNLAKPPFPMKGPLDVVLIRNVMIYFDNVVRQRLVSEAERLLAPGGVLMIGHSETLNEIRTGLRPVRPSVYRKVAS
jgi:chemotaxis protein methyltransferase CheR